MTDRKAAERIGDELEGLGGVHVLVNDAGIMPLGPMVEGRVEEWDQMIDINVRGLLYTTHAVLSRMAKRKQGDIVNIGSVASKYAFAGGAVYSGTKFAVRSITEPYEPRTAVLISMMKRREVSCPAKSQPSTRTA